MKIPAIQYRRVSTKEQDDKGFSPETQDADNRTYAARCDFEIVADFFDDESGMILERPGLTDARQFLIEHPEVRAIVIHNNDRLTRKSIHYSILREEFEVLGIELHYSTRGKVDFGFGGQVSEDIWGRFAEEWRRTLLERTRKGKRTKAQEGNVIASQRPPYGYRWTEGKLIIHEEEAQVIRLIFRLYLVDGYSTTKIAEYLTQQKIPTYSDIHNAYKKNGYGFWLPKTIRQIITNETYAGVWYWGKNKRQTFFVGGKKKQRWTEAARSEWIAVPVPAIINHDQWERAQVRAQFNKEQASRNMRHQYLLAKRLTCSACARKLYCQCENGETRYKYYYCSSRQTHQFQGQKCGLPFLRVDRFDDGAWRWIKKVLQNPDYLEQLIDASLESDSGEYDALTAELNSVQASIALKERELKRLLLAFARSSDEDTSDIDAVRIELKAEIKALKEREQALGDKLSQAVLKDELSAFAECFYLFQEGLALEDDEPFEIRAAWVKALQLAGVVEVRDGQKLAHLSSILDSTVLPIVEGTLPSLPRNFIKIHYTLNLSELGI